MKYLALILAVVFISACDHGGGGGNGDGGSAPRPRPGELLPNWGELSCQRSSSCTNPVLNVPRLQLENLLQTEFSEVIGGHSADLLAWSCGKKTVAEWNRKFPGQAFSAAADGDLAEFFYQMLDVSTCMAHADIATKLTTYFKNTKEYKNEVPQQIDRNRIRGPHAGSGEGRAG